jgi:UDP-glucose 4-epimerase
MNNLKNRATVTEPRVLLTGGAGFIGSHTCLALIAAGFRVTILDNFENAQADVPKRLEQIAGCAIPLLHVDVRDPGAVEQVFRDGNFDAVVHFAARKSVPDSVADPLGYYSSNCGGLLNVLSAMRNAGVTRIVFSSSAAIYGMPEIMPISETTPPSPLNPYAESKVFGENILLALGHAHPEMRIGILRYFNPVGAHESGLIGEDPSQPPGNLVPVIGRVAVGHLERLTVFGGDWETPDGTGIRDYIHVEDLAHGHVLSLQALFGTTGSHLVNLGTGTGYSVLDVTRMYSEVSARDIPFKIVERRAGDAAVSFAATDKARTVLGFQAKHDLRSMCASSWAYLRARSTSYQTGGVAARSTGLAPAPTVRTPSSA